MGFDYRASIIPMYGICVFGVMSLDTMAKNARIVVVTLASIQPVLIMAALVTIVGLSRVPRFDPIKFKLGDFGGASAAEIEYSVGQITMSLLFAGFSFSVYNMLHHFKSHDEIQYLVTYTKVEEDEECYMFTFAPTPVKLTDEENNQQLQS